MSSESSQHLQDLGHDLHILRTPKPAPWNASKIIIEGPRKRTQNISWPGPKRNSAKISTASQRERSATHKVTRRLREPCQNSQRATTRAIRHTQCTETVARAMSKFDPARYNESDPTRTKCREGCARAISNCHRATNRAIRHTHTKWPEGCGFQPLFCRSLQSTAPATKNWARGQPGPALCESLGSRNAHGHLARALLRRNLHQTFRAAESVPWSNPGPLAYWVWTHCLGKNPPSTV